MTDTTPQTGTVENAPAPLSFDEGVSAIESLFSDDLDETPKGTDGQNPVEAKGDEPEDEELVIDDDDGSEPESEESREPAVTIDDDYEIEIEGEKVTLGELKKGSLRQRDYTKKTEEVARQRDELAHERQTVQQLRDQAEAEIAQERQRLYQVAARYFPQKPTREMLDSDPIGYMQAMEDYNARVDEMKALEYEDQQRAATQQASQQEQTKEWTQKQRAVLFDKVPSLKDETKRNAFISDLQQIGMNEYGLTADEIPQITDARYLRIVHDAIQYQKAKARAAATKQTLETKPKMKQQQRMNVNAAQGRDKMGRYQELQRSHSLAAAAKSIEDLL